MKMKNDGFTLVEVMVSMILLALVMAGGMGMFTNSNSFLRISLDKKIATEFASTSLEEIRLQNYASLPSSGTIVMNPITLGDINATDISIYTDVGSLKRVDKIVAWTQSGRNKSRTVKLTTYIAP